MPRAPGQDALPLGSLLLELTTIFDFSRSIAGRSSSCGIRLPEGGRRNCIIIARAIIDHDKGRILSNPAP